MTFGIIYLKCDALRSNPSLTEYAGEYPSIFRAREISAHDFFISPSLEGMYMTETSIPKIVFTLSASSFSEVCPLKPILNIPRVPLSIVRICKDTTSRTKTKSSVGKDEILRISSSMKVNCGFLRASKILFSLIDRDSNL